MPEKIAFAFPGVGVKFCGHEQAFFERFQTVIGPILAEASDFAGFDCVSLLSNPDLACDERQSQLFTYAFNCAVAKAYRVEGYQPDLMAGHSMGLYSALATSGTIQFSDGLKIVEKAYLLATDACSELDCAMAVVVGLGQAEIDELLKDFDETSVVLVNSNNDTTKIFAGSKPDLEEFTRSAQDHDALKSALMPVSAPYHHPGFLRAASERFEGSLQSFSWSSPSCSIVSTIDGTLLDEPRDLLDLTARNLSTPINWEGVIDTMRGQSTDRIFECGAGISLFQNGRFIPDCPPIVTIKNAKRKLGL